MTKTCLSVLVFTLVTAMSNVPSEAAPPKIFDAVVRCDLNANNLWNQSGDNPGGTYNVGSVVGNGLVRFFQQDIFKFTMTHTVNGGLRPGAQFSCRMTCMGNCPTCRNGAAEPVIVENCGTTSPAGDAAFKVKEFRVGHSTANLPAGASEICLGPVFEIWETFRPLCAGGVCSTAAQSFAAGGNVCMNGFGTGGGAL